MFQESKINLVDEAVFFVSQNSKSPIKMKFGFNVTSKMCFVNQNSKKRKLEKADERLLI